MSLEVRPATSHADRLAVLTVSHAATDAARPFEHHAALRLRGALRRHATWWLAQEDGRPVSALICYPLLFAHGDAERPGYGLGAVATVPEARGRGHASALCRAVCADAEARGQEVGLLFSAIPPALYERLGFRVTSATAPVCEDLAALVASGDVTELAPLDPYHGAREILALYADHHEGLHLARTSEGWPRNLEVNATDAFYGVGEPLRGYVRVDREDEEALEVLELIARPVDAAPLLRAVARLAHALGRKRVEGWFDVPEELQDHFRDRGRARTLPMVRGHEELGGARFWASDYF